MPAGSMRETLRVSGLRPRKSLGQNFLRDRSVLPRILSAAEIEPGDAVLEIGPGTGVLTQALLAAGAHVTAVELDNVLYQALRTHFAEESNLHLLNGDALALDPCAEMPERYKLVANIPYYITGPLLRHCLEAACQPRVLVLMVQREVAERMAAAPGKLSMLGVSVQYYAAVTVMGRVPAGAFFPRPKVDSAIVRLIPYRCATGDARQQALFRLLHAGFSARRKQLTNALMNGLGETRLECLELLQAASIQPERRAETLSIAEWELLASAWLARAERDR